MRATPDEDLHDLLTGHFPLVVDPAERGNGRSYFLRTVDWRPATVTRILRVLFDGQGRATRIRLCPSSDNNNSVFIELPCDQRMMIARITQEIELYEAAGHATSLDEIMDYYQFHPEFLGLATLLMIGSCQEALG